MLGKAVMRMPLRERLRRWMAGRYSTIDALYRFLSTAAMVLILLALVLRLPLLDWIALALLIYAWYRLLSRDIARRAAENAAFVRWQQQVLGAVRQRRVRWAQRRLYLYCRCPACRQQVRVPRGHGRVAITCPKCHTEFVKKS